MIQINAYAGGAFILEGMAVARVSSLSPSEFDEALVLAGLGGVDLDAELWRLQALARLGDRAGGDVLIARNQNGSACGLLIYRIARDASARRSLEVERLVAFHLLRPNDIADQLVAEAVRRARLQNCDSLRLVRPLDTPADTLALVLASGVAELHSVF